jgi:CheY-like chemotaxis protein
MGHKDVLVVDDDHDMAHVMLRALRLAGYSARSAANGKLALEAVEARLPALILLDMLMPVMDGWQCARELRSRYANTIPIVVVTAAEDARARGIAIGADAVLAKPFELHELLRLVTQYVDNGPRAVLSRA